MASSLGGYNVTEYGMEKGFLNIQELHKHMYTHMREREFLCSICKCTIVDPDCVEDHMWTHLKFYECIICNGGLPDLVTFMKHLEAHCDDEGIEIDMMAAIQIAEQRMQETKAQLRFKCRIYDSMIATIDNIQKNSSPIKGKAKTKPKTKPRPRSSRKKCYTTLAKQAKDAKITAVKFNEFLNEDYYQNFYEDMPIAKIQFDELVGEVFSIIEHD